MRVLVASLLGPLSANEF